MWLLIILVSSAYTMLGSGLVTLLCVPLLVRSSQVYRFGTPDNLGTDQHEPDGSPDFLLWRSENLPDGPFPSQFTLCFSMFYTALDYWSANQKTLLRIYQVENSEHFWMRVNHSPPRGTMIMNRANLWSGGLGDFRSDRFNREVDITVVISGMRTMPSSDGLLSVTALTSLGAG